MSHAVLVFAEDSVADPVEPVFDMPVISPPAEQRRGVSLMAGHAGDGVSRFDRLFAVTNDASREAADLH